MDNCTWLDEEDSVAVVDEAFEMLEECIKEGNHHYRQGKSSAHEHKGTISTSNLCNAMAYMKRMPEAKLTKKLSRRGTSMSTGFHNTSDADLAGFGHENYGLMMELLRKVPSALVHSCC